MHINVIFQPTGRRGKICSGKTILEACQKFGINLESPCGGNGACGKCKVKLEKISCNKESDFSNSSISPITEKEREILTKEEQLQNFRLACCTKITEDMVIFVPEKSEKGKQRILETSESKLFHLNPGVKKYYIELESPTLEDCRDDFTRVKDALLHKYKNLEKHISMDYKVMQTLSSLLRKEKYKITVTLWMDKEIISVEPGFNENIYGVAMDVGTTTIAAALCDLSTGEVITQISSLNPQIIYGEDILSRISYCSINKNGLEEMHNLIIKEINKLLKELAASINRDVNQIYDMVIVFNTAMHHIALNINPEYLGQSPFTPVISQGLNIKARELDINICKGAYMYSLPIEGGFVGSDNVSVLISQETYKQDKMLIIIDIGTNGEIDFGNREGLFSTSCATGPALEGAQIKYGMRAVTGAIERVKINPLSLEVDFKVIGEDKWNNAAEMGGVKGICGSGIIDAVAEMYKNGIIGKDGTFDKKIVCSRIRRDEEGRMEYVLVWKRHTSIGVDISITQKDVRAVQLAKSALYAGAKVLMKKMNVDSVEGVILAGAFGSYINKENALVIGLFPDCDLNNVVVVGNAAGEGAKIALLSTDKRTEAEEVAKDVQFIECAAEKDFEMEFYNAMNFPHSEDEFPHIKHILDSIPE
ncbi:ASKHA domain-containing protein [Clostridium kluyveri]|uniref:Ferredoxin n=1 Tax=Clostridium kluyveri TaxID=1534 RepID=A0A1L5F4Y3_CLOKL|nr:ASKHA domain-containing protein [Clostridium kluyveri]APM38081.1 ferredoxin [Clostridium kluyveri]UZQ51907.1 ASKHA domain-containing protein [Clostridium kluyveri]